MDKGGSESIINSASQLSSAVLGYFWRYYLFGSSLVFRLPLDSCLPIFSSQSPVHARTEKENVAGTTYEYVGR